MKWLDEKLKPLSLNTYSITDIFTFTDEITNVKFNESNLLVSYNVASLFTNVPLDETINIIADKVFTDDWFNKQHGLNITRSDVIELLKLAIKDQLFQYHGNLYEQKDGVGMGSPLGPIMANTFLCHIEEQLNLPDFSTRYVDDTLTIMPSEVAATNFLNNLNNFHPSLCFTMEIASNIKLPFLGMLLEKNGAQITTHVFRKPTDKGLLLHYQSHVDQSYKSALIRTMLNRAYPLSSSRDLFIEECKNLRNILMRLKYPNNLIIAAIMTLVAK